MHIIRFLFSQPICQKLIPVMLSPEGKSLATAETGFTASKN